MACLLALACGAPAAALCSDPQPRLVCAEYFASEVVVEATLTNVETLGDQDAFVYGLRVNQVLRGRIGPFFEVYEGNDSGRATFAWKRGETYLLFLSYSRHDQAWEADGCGNSGPLPISIEALREIDAIQAHPGSGFIHGEIKPKNSSDDRAAAGVAIEALGASGTFRALANEKGQFVIEVPPGRYRLRASKAGWSFATTEFSYENPSRLLIQPGGCVQVEFYGYLER